MHLISGRVIDRGLRSSTNRGDRSSRPCMQSSDGFSAPRRSHDHNRNARQVEAEHDAGRNHGPAQSVLDRQYNEGNDQRNRDRGVAKDVGEQVSSSCT